LDLEPLILQQAFILMADSKHCCYIVICRDNTLYCGYSNDVEKRVRNHNKGCGAKYTKTRLPVKLVYTECFDNKSDAMKREYQIKQLTRQQKLKLIHEKQKSIHTN
jgi:putative endonuclease